MSKDRSVMMPTMALVIAAVAWGSTVVVAKSAYDQISAASLLIMRLILAVVSLTPLAFSLRAASCRTLIKGALLGLIYNGSLALQLIGLQFTAPSLSGFVTASYVIFTALISAIVLRQRQPTLTWVAVVITVVGLTVLALGHESGEGFGLGAGLTLLGAVGFAIHIVYLGKWVKRDTMYPLIFMQALAGAAAAVLFIPFVNFELPNSPTTWVQLLYLGIFCSGVTLFLQTWAQNYVSATPASMIMCSEPVWAALLAISFGFEPLTVFVVVGGSLVVMALLLSANPQKRSQQMEALLTDLRRRTRR